MADEYLPPEMTETILRRAHEVEAGIVKTVSLDEMIAEWERDPEMKAALDEARARYRESGGLKLDIRPVVLTERGLKVCDVEEANG